MTIHPIAGRLSRLDYAHELARVVSWRAACTRRQVGVVILDSAGRVGGTGYNGTPAGAPHCTDGGCPRGQYSHDQIPGLLGNTGHPVPCTARHAEDNATEWALEVVGVDPTTSLVAITCPPCPPCHELLTNQRWGRVSWTNPDHSRSSFGTSPLSDWT